MIVQLVGRVATSAGASQGFETHLDDDASVRDEVLALPLGLHHRHPDGLLQHGLTREQLVRAAASAAFDPDILRKSFNFFLNAQVAERQWSNGWRTRLLRRRPGFDSRRC